MEEEKMIIRFENVVDVKTIKDKINESKKEIELLEKTDFSKELELNETNLEKIQQIKKAYRNIVTKDWTYKPLKIVIANPDGTELAIIN